MSDPRVPNPEKLQLWHSSSAAGLQYFRSRSIPFHTPGIDGEDDIGKLGGEVSVVAGLSATLGFDLADCEHYISTLTWYVPRECHPAAR